MSTKSKTLTAMMAVALVTSGCAGGTGSVAVQETLVAEGVR